MSAMLKHLAKKASEGSQACEGLLCVLLARQTNQLSINAFDDESNIPIVDEFADFIDSHGRKGKSYTYLMSRTESKIRQKNLDLESRRIQKHIRTLCLVGYKRLGAMEQVLVNGRFPEQDQLDVNAISHSLDTITSLYMSLSRKTVMGISYNQAYAPWDDAGTYARRHFAAFEEKIRLDLETNGLHQMERPRPAILPETSTSDIPNLLFHSYKCDKSLILREIQTYARADFLDNEGWNAMHYLISNPSTDDDEMLEAAEILFENGCPMTVTDTGISLPELLKGLPAHPKTNSFISKNILMAKQSEARHPLRSGL